MQQPIRTAVVGFGLAGSVFHAPAIAAHPRYSLDFIVTANPERRALAQRRYPQARIVDTAEELFARPEVDLVVLGTPPASHAPLAHAALDRRIAVVVDKPFALTSVQGQQLMDHAAELGVPLTVYQNRRWDGEYLTLRKLLDEGALGDVYRFESRMERWSQEISKPWKADATAHDGGGLLYDLGSHLIDQALQLFGPVTQVYGELSARRPQEKADDDDFVALLHANGVRSHLWMNLSAAQKGPRLRVLGSTAAYTKATADLQEAQIIAGVLPGTPGYGEDPEQNWGVLGLDGALVPVPTEPGNFPAFYQLLAAALLDGGPLPVDPADAVEALRIIEAVRAQHR